MAQTAAWRGLRPVANAFGASVGLMYRRGIGWCAACASSRTARYMAGASASVTGRACMARKAIVSERKYA